MRLKFALLLGLTLPMIAQSLCVSVDTANLRSGPSANYPKSWEVYKHMPFQLVKKEGEWYQVEDLEGDKHWIHKKLVTDKFKCAAIKATKANLRTGPGTRYPQSVVYPTADKFEAFKVIKIEGDWALIQDADGDKMWASKDLLWIQ